MGAAGAAARLASRSPVHVVARRRARRRLTVLAYHGIDDPDGFAEQMELLARTAHPVALDDVIRAGRTGGRLPDGATLVTFDDGDRSLHDHALPILRRSGIPAVAFVVTDLLGTDEPFWWQIVAAAAARGVAGGAPARLAGLGPTAAVERCKIVPDEERLELVAACRAALPELPRTHHLDAAQLRELAGGGVAIGSHTASHPLLDRCPPEKARDEVLGSFACLAGVLGQPIRSFAYPNGNVSGAARAALEDSGCEVAFAYDERLSPNPPPDLLSVSRVQVYPHKGLDRFELARSGLAPAARRLLRRA